MAIVSYMGESYECVVPLKGKDYIHLLDANGNMVAAFDGVKDFGNFSISGGVFLTLPSDENLNVAVLRADGTIGNGKRKCCDLVVAGQDVSLGVVTAKKVIGAVYA